MRVEFGLLGEVRAQADGVPISLGPARPRCILAVLLVNANRSVSCYQIVDRVWGDGPPQQAAGTVRSYLSRLRTRLPAGADCTLGRSTGGYVLHVDEDAVDLHRFRRLLARARAAGDDGAAASLYDQALALWQGEPFAGLDSAWLASERHRLEAEHFAARLDRNDLHLRQGNHTAVLADITALHAQHPLDERLVGQLVLALYRSGRQADALQRYEQLRRHLAEEVGADPSPELQRLHQQILAADVRVAERSTVTAPAVAGSAATVSAATAATAPVPRQLPTSPVPFTGRTRELATLDAILRPGRPTPDAGHIAAIVGSGGIGKTWLALHWAHRNLDAFPDGQLYVNLRGFAPGDGLVPAGVALRGFLDALGVDPARIPVEDVDAQAALYRSLVADRRMLIMLDNARSTEQVAPLLPGGSSCTLLVTSRHQLAGLLTGHGARPVALDVLDTAEGHQLLSRRLGAERLETEPQAAAALLDQCAGLPLALSIVAARANLHPGIPLSALADELGEGSARLDALDAGELTADVRTVFSWSYRALTPDTARLFRLLSLHPGPDFTAQAAAALADVPLARARQGLDRLTSAHLVQRPGADRYAFHDLIRLYAAERAGAEEARGKAGRRSSASATGTSTSRTPRRSCWAPSGCARTSHPLPWGSTPLVRPSTAGRRPRPG